MKTLKIQMSPQEVGETNSPQMDMLMHQANLDAQRPHSLYSCLENNQPDRSPVQKIYK